MRNHNIAAAILLIVAFNMMPAVRLQSAVAQGKVGYGYIPQPVTGRPVGGVPFGYGGGYGGSYSGVPNYTRAYTPVYSVPVAAGAGNYLLNGSNFNNRSFWRSTSGYYYPWANNSAYGEIIYAPQDNVAPTAQVPPLSTLFADLLKFLEQKKASGALLASDFDHLRRRATDLQTKYFDLRTAGDGTIDPHDEAQIRKDLDELGAEISRAIKT